jgi:hypothetical protein
MQIHNNVVPHGEIDNILFLVGQHHPEAFISNSYNESVHDALQHLRFLPYNYVDVSGSCNDFVLLSSVNSEDDYGGRMWHSDGNDNETTVLLYLQGDPESGGEFCTEDSKNKFEVGTMFVLNSCELHMVEPYNNELARIALKWKFK